MSLLPLELARAKLDLGLQPGPVATRNSGGTSEELPLERKKASFDVEKMTNILDGGADQTRRRRWIQAAAVRVSESRRSNPQGANSFGMRFLHEAVAINTPN